MKSFMRITGYLNIASGILLLAFWYLYAVLLPYGELSDTISILVLDKDWIFVNLLGSVGAMAGIVGMIGLFFSVQDEMTWVGVAGFLVAITGTILIFLSLVRDTMLWPVVVAHDPHLLDFSGPIYSSSVFMPFFIASAVVYAVGNLAFGLFLASCKRYPVLAGHLLAWGALLFGLGPAFGSLQVIIRSVGITALSAGLVWVGLLMALDKKSRTA